jgi:hypothetical protein
MPSTNIARFNAHPLSRRRRRLTSDGRDIVAEYRHALEQLAIQSTYPGREPSPQLPQSKFRRGQASMMRRSND